MAKYRGKNKYKFGAVLFCSVAFVMCFTLISAWGQSHNSRTNNQIAEAISADENSNDTNAWELRDYPRTETFLVNLIKRYYGEYQGSGKTEENCRRELKATSNNLITDSSNPKCTKFGRDASGKQIMMLQQWSNGKDGIYDKTHCPSSLSDDMKKRTFFVINPDIMPRDETTGQAEFPSDKFTEFIPSNEDQASGTNICTMYFNDAGMVDGEHVDMMFRINTVKVKARESSTGKYGEKAPSVADKKNVGLVFGSLTPWTIWENYIKTYNPEEGQPLINPDFPQIAGSISLTSDNLIWNYDKAVERLQVEIDYSIAIINHDKAQPTPFKYPVYTLYSDLDVNTYSRSASVLSDTKWSNEYKSGITGEYKQYPGNVTGQNINCMFDESVTPYENVYPYAYRFAKAETKSESPFYIEKIEDNAVKSGSPTFRADPHYYNSGTSSSPNYEYAVQYSDGFPKSWYNTGVVITSDPSSESGSYSAVWRGVQCETGISLSPCPSYTSYKYVEQDTGHTLPANEAYVEPYKTEEQSATTDTDSTDTDSTEEQADAGLSNSTAKQVSTTVEQSTTTDANGYYTFDVDFGDKNSSTGSGEYGTDMFYAPQTLHFIDYLPAGLEVVGGMTAENLQQAIANNNIKLVKLKSGTESKVDIQMTSGGLYDITCTPQYENGKLVSNKIIVQVDQNFAYKTDNWDGSTWRMVLKARPKALDETQEKTGSAAGYSTGERAKYPNTDTYMWKYQNIGAVDSEGYEFKSKAVDVYTPLFGRDYTFYQLNEKGEPTETAVPDAVNATKPAVVSNTYKVGETVDIGSLQPTSTSVKDGDDLWLFTNWKQTSQTVPNPGADLNFIGYWKKITNPTETKKYDETKKDKGYVTDDSAVLLDDKIAYEMVATNNSYSSSDPSTATIKFEDVPSVGLTLEPTTIKVCKELNGTTSELTAGTDYTFTNNLKGNKGDGTSSFVVDFDESHKVNYTAKIKVTYSCIVNEDAPKATSKNVVNKTNITIANNPTQTYDLTNKVIQPESNKIDGKKLWSDQVPVGVQGSYYNIKIDKVSYSSENGIDASAFVNFQLQPHNTKLSRTRVVEYETMRQLTEIWGYGFV